MIAIQRIAGLASAVVKNKSILFCDFKNIVVYIEEKLNNNFLQVADVQVCDSAMIEKYDIFDVAESLILRKPVHCTAKLEILENLPTQNWLEHQ